MPFNKIPVGIATKDVAFNQDVKSIKPKESLKSEFLLYWFLSSEHKLLNMVSGTGIGAGKLDTQDFLEMDLCIPTIPDQTKIANFLTTVDEKIAQLTQKTNFLARYKKGVMQQLFSQQLRFKDDNGQDFPEWEESELGKVTDIIMGQSPDSKSYNDRAQGMPLIQGNADISNRKSNPRIWTSEPTKECKTNDIILTVRAPVGAVAKS